MRILFQIMTIFKCTRLAFINVDSHHPRAFKTTDDTPFSARWKTGSTQPTQTGIFHFLDDGFGTDIAFQQFFQCLITAVSLILFHIKVIANFCLNIIIVNCLGHSFCCSLVNRVLTDDSDRSVLTTPDTRHFLNSNIIVQAFFQSLYQFISTRH